jgi:3-oxoacyl-[acyl-carrier-protein] synthase-1
MPAAEVAGRVCRIRDEGGGTAAERLARQLVAAWREAGAPAGPRLGVVLASTKGAVEDVVWSAPPAVLKDDTLAPVLARFLELAALTPARALCLSNACSSAHVALELARHWLAARAVEQVLVLAADQAGPFALRGFASLKSLAPERVTPFGAGRQGIQLGEAAVALWLSAAGVAAPVARLAGVATQVEGYAVTRSHEGGATLAAVCRSVCGAREPGAVIAHGTGTLANDAMEDGVYFRLFGARVPITCTKWSVGHCLGASGAVDVVAALAMMRHGLFAVANTSQLDPAMRARYLTPDRREGDTQPPASVLVASAGFGGMHGAVWVEKP